MDIELTFKAANRTRLASQLSRAWLNSPITEIVTGTLDTGLKKRPLNADWLKLGERESTDVAWNVADYLLAIDHEQDVVRASIIAHFPTTRSILDFLVPLDFETAVIKPWIPEVARSWCKGPGEGHGELGIGIAFKGAGFDCVSHPRFLDQPFWWHVRHQGMSFIQFHDLAVSTVEEYESVTTLPHRLFGWSPFWGGGVFFTKGHPYKSDIRGFYVAEDRTLRITVAGRQVSQAELIDACAFRYENNRGGKPPIDQVVFVYMDPAQAKADLPYLWVRGHGCRTIDPAIGREVLLDTDYQLPPVPELEWITAARAREGL